MTRPEPGDLVVPAHPTAGRVVARDVRGGQAGVLVEWPGMAPVWYPDDRGELVVIEHDGRRVAQGTTSRAASRPRP